MHLESPTTASCTGSLLTFYDACILAPGFVRVRVNWSYSEAVDRARCKIWEAYFWQSFAWIGRPAGVRYLVSYSPACGEYFKISCRFRLRSTVKDFIKLMDLYISFNNIVAASRYWENCVTGLLRNTSRNTWSYGLQFMHFSPFKRKTVSALKERDTC